ncbi:MAG TPA: hypothetical protein VF068_01045, partial [Rubrobacter sp.]
MRTLPARNADVTMDDGRREFARAGVAPVKKYLADGVRVALGANGSASNYASNILLGARRA